jgi:tRNA-intron endonuclease
MLTMQGELSGGKVVVEGSEADILAKGYGRKKGKLELSLEEAAFLLETGKIAIKNEEEKEIPHAEFLKHALDISPRFELRYLVYRDLKERGYVVQPGRVEFWLYPRGTVPGEKPARYVIRIVSEREFISFKNLDALLTSAHNMRKEPIIAVVDEESDITYYELKEAQFEKREEQKEGGRIGKATLLGDRAVLWDADLAETLYRNNFYGKLTKEKRLLLSMVETAYLMKKGLLELNEQQPLTSANVDQLIDYATAVESEFKDKYEVYTELREKGLILKTGFKFGSHFRVYEALNQRHSSYLVHVLFEEHVFSLSELSRAVRLAHGVKKRMIFAVKKRARKKDAQQQALDNQRIRYVDIGRMKL